MAQRTVAVGDVHGDLEHLEALLSLLPPLDAKDTIVFLGDYVDRGPRSAEVVDLVRNGLGRRVAAKIVALRGNHEDAWLEARAQGNAKFVLPVGNGCLATLRSFAGAAAPVGEEAPSKEEFLSMAAGRFLPDDVVTWMASLPVWYEDDHAIYVHAGLPEVGGRFPHPSELADPRLLMWQRTKKFFEEYAGKRVVFGHTGADALPQQLSTYTPADGGDLFYRGCAVGIDTRCGNGGFLTAIELPRLVVYESRRPIAGR